MVTSDGMSIIIDISGEDLGRDGRIILQTTLEVGKGLMSKYLYINTQIIYCAFNINIYSIIAAQKEYFLLTLSCVKYEAN